MAVKLLFRSPLLQNCEEGFASLQAASEPAVRCRVVVIFSGGGGGRNNG